jgi:hypothetical protein
MGMRISESQFLLIQSTEGKELEGWEMLLKKEAAT